MASTSDLDAYISSFEKENKGTESYDVSSSSVQTEFPKNSTQPHEIQTCWHSQTQKKSFQAEPRPRPPPVPFPRLEARSIRSTLRKAHRETQERISPDLAFGNFPALISPADSHYSSGLARYYLPRIKALAASPRRGKVGNIIPTRGLRCLEVEDIGSHDGNANDSDSTTSTEHIERPLDFDRIYRDMEGIDKDNDDALVDINSKQPSQENVPSALKSLNFFEAKMKAPSPSLHRKSGVKVGVVMPRGQSVRQRPAAREQPQLTVTSISSPAGTGIRTTSPLKRLIGVVQRAESQHDATSENSMWHLGQISNPDDPSWRRMHFECCAACQREVRVTRGNRHPRPIGTEAFFVSVSCYARAKARMLLISDKRLWLPDVQKEGKTEHMGQKTSGQLGLRVGVSIS
ncbi:hypothetical protein AAMO2058_000553800 [Amorphochlora amoebiformis]|eukprot:964823-Amorphochlora_amoeboformis.AAC.2